MKKVLHYLLPSVTDTVSINSVNNNNSNMKKSLFNAIKLSLLLVLCLVIGKTTQAQVIVETFEASAWSTATQMTNSSSGTLSFNVASSTSTNQTITTALNCTSINSATATLQAQQSAGSISWIYSKASVFSLTASSKSATRVNSYTHSFSMSSSSSFLITPVLNNGIATISFYAMTTSSASSGFFVGINTNTNAAAPTTGSVCTSGANSTLNSLFTLSSSTISVGTNMASYKYSYTGTFTDPVRVFLGNLTGQTLYLDDIVITTPNTSCSAPTISVQPTTSTQTICAGATAPTVSVTASTTSGTLAYQWYSLASLSGSTTTDTTSGTLVSGATSTTYSIPNNTASALFYYCKVSAGSACNYLKSNVSGKVTVNTLPVALVLTGSTVCSGVTTTITSSTSVSGINYQLYNSSAATVGSAVPGTGSGLTWSGVAAGTGYYVIGTNATTSCVSASSNLVNVVVNSLPSVSITGSSSVCIGLTTQLSPTSGGTWASSSNSLATVTNGGVVTGVAAGSPTFTFTNTTTNCSATTSSVTVNALPTVSINGSSICVGATTTLTPSSGGTWASNNTGVATVSGNTVTGVAAGSTTFTFTDGTTGCTKTTSTLSVNTIPTFSSVSSSNTVLNDGGIATITLNGLLVNTAHTISYTISGTAGTQSASATSNGSGVATFNTIALNGANSDGTITITGITATPCSITPGLNNTATLPTVLTCTTPTFTSIAQNATVCSGSLATMNLTGLVASSIDDTIY